MIDQQLLALIAAALSPTDPEFQANFAIAVIAMIALIVVVFGVALLPFRRGAKERD
jgi:hypothetical protein